MRAVLILLVIKINKGFRSKYDFQKRNLRNVMQGLLHWRL